MSLDYSLLVSCAKKPEEILKNCNSLAAIQSVQDKSPRIEEEVVNCVEPTMLCCRAYLQDLNLILRITFQAATKEGLHLYTYPNCSGQYSDE